ncbi:MAG TPA: zf-HC2 domain-containing protein [Ktedonobacterales bacterium]|jgi:photosystem II stability/assembly factor-like uncharacterized protein|nr:zf-HC2 domain-containing protein [Ktedonobacterales bacterium]
MTPIASTETHESWLRRVSDYHSGGMDADERARVEAHLATCAECREVLAMYQRFYALTRSPLALGAPRVDLAERPAARAPSPLRIRHTPLEQGAPLPWSGRARVGLAAGLVAALLIGSFLAVFSLRQHGPVAQPTPTPLGSLTPFPNATATPEAVAPADWTQVPLTGDGGVPSVTFSPTSPRVGYGCSISANHVISVSRTQDGGSNWTTVGTVGRIGTCLISVDPYNAQDVALVAPDFGVFRSFDGGQSWASDIDYSTQGSFQRWGWAGSRLLLVTTSGTGASAKTHLFSSTPATRSIQLDSDGFLGGFRLQQVYLLAGPAGGNLIYVVDGPAGASVAQERTLSSADGGSSWTETTFTNQGARVQPVAFSADGFSIAAVDGSFLSLSSDGGRTWQQPTAFAGGGEIDYRSLFLVSGSTVVAISTNFAQGDRNIYAITAGRTHTWAKTPVPAGGRLVAVAIGLDGLPASHWIERPANSQRTSGVVLWRKADNSPPLVVPMGA